MDAFADSNLYVSTFKNVMLESVRAENGGRPFGVFAHTLIMALSVPGALFIYDPSNPATQGLPPDFEVGKV